MEFREYLAYEVAAAEDAFIAGPLLASAAELANELPAAGTAAQASAIEIGDSPTGGPVENELAVSTAGVFGSAAELGEDKVGILGGERPVAEQDGMAGPGVAVRLLLDTHTFLWAAGDPARLSRKAHRALTTERNELYLSTASLWEMAIKRSLGKLDLEMSLSGLLDLCRQKLDLRLIEIVAAHALAVEHLPLHHRDPFDRMLVVQARVEGVGLISSNEALDRYGVQRLW